ncbi:MAG TPA: amidase [Solirubrobacteraceae bacterium]|jgi:amidase|nr:amidase [Solirubrobacteraceae bacterium]
MTALGPSSSALELAAALRARELSASELLEACLAAVDELNPQLNAVVWRDDEEARAAARIADGRLAEGANGEGDWARWCPFLGVPIPIKDLTPVAGWPVTYGSRGAPEGVSERSELVVDALRLAGFVLCGRTNTPEFGVLTVAENSRYGISRNPWDTGRSPGGSSGGAGAAVAAGMFPIAHANDGGGSIRIPASYCGLVGFKPSRGRVPRLAQSWLGAVVEGVEARTVADAAAVLDTISRPDPRAWYNAPASHRTFAEQASAPEKLRVGLMAEAPMGIPTDEPCAAGARAVAALLEELGHTVEEVQVPTVSEEMIPPFISLTIAGLADYDGVDWSAVDAHIAHQRKAAGELSAYDYALAIRSLELLSRRETARWGRDFDVLVTPTSAILPPVAGAILEAQLAAPDQPVLDVVRSVSFTAFGNVAGLPAVSLPLHWSDEGLPVGVQLTGGPWQDGAVLALAGQLEAARPWAERRPPLAASAR